MTIPIDYNKMQAELDKRHYMSQVYISNIETWKPTQLGVKTYGKWCDLVNWENLLNEKQTSSDDFMNLAVKRKWAEIYYSFEEKQNVCEPTKFGHDLFKTFECWIDEKAQKKVRQKETVRKVAKGGMSFMAITLPKIIQGITEMMAGLSKGFEGLNYQKPEKKPEKKTGKKRGKKKTKTNKPKPQPSDTNVNDPSWSNWANNWNKERKGDWSQLN